MLNIVACIFVTAAVIFITTLGLSRAQLLYVGLCPQDVQTEENFNITSFLGKWYEYSKYSFIFEIDAKCVYTRYGKLSNDEISIYNFDIDRITGRSTDIELVGKAVDSGKLLVRFPNTPGFLGGANYWVLGTDYINYAAVYSCTQLGPLHARVVWILTRQQYPSDGTVQDALGIITKNGLSAAPLQQTDQQSCPKNITSM